MLFQRVALRLAARAGCALAKITLSRQVTDSHVVARNQVAHDFRTDTRHGPSVSRHGVAPRKPQAVRLVRKRARAFHSRSPPGSAMRTQTPRACPRRQTGGRIQANGDVVLRAGRCHQLLPGLLQKATFHGRFGHGHAQGRQQLGAGRCVIQLGQHAIQLGACGFFIQRRAAGWVNETEALTGRSLSIRFVRSTDQSRGSHCTS